VDNCSGDVNHGTSGSDSKEDTGSLSDAEYGDEGNKEDGRDNKDGLHRFVWCGCEAGIEPAWIVLWNLHEQGRPVKAVTVSRFFEDSHFPPVVIMEDIGDMLALYKHEVGAALELCFLFHGGVHLVCGV